MFCKSRPLSLLLGLHLGSFGAMFYYTPLGSPRRPKEASFREVNFQVDFSVTSGGHGGSRPRKLMGGRGTSAMKVLVAKREIKRGVQAIESQCLSILASRGWRIMFQTNGFEQVLLQVASTPQVRNSSLQRDSRPQIPDSTLQTQDLRLQTPVLKLHTPDSRFQTSRFQIPDSRNQLQFPDCRLQIPKLQT